MRTMRRIACEGPNQIIRWQGVRPVLAETGHGSGASALATNVNKGT
jgi:hypothetical protein